MLRSVFLMFLLAHSEPPQPACSPQPERVFLGAVSSNTIDFVRRTVEVCGTFRGSSDFDPHERVMYDVSAYSGEYFGLYVLDPHRRLGADGVQTCIVGTPRRRDGFSPEEANARGLGNENMADAAVRHYLYVFYPADCDALARG